MKVLLTFKMSTLEREGSNPSFKNLDKITRLKLLDSDRENRTSIHDVFYTLVSRHIDVQLVRRDEVKRMIMNKQYDLVVAVGGDGTLFQVALYVQNTPCILVNSDPANSMGIFASCAREQFEENLDSFLQNEHKITEISRGQVYLDNKPLHELFTNDVLLTHQNPASIYRYKLNTGSIQENVESSGLWVSTSAGSTAAIYAAGGQVMKLNDKRLQYLIREPYALRRAYKKVNGFSTGIQISALSANGVLYLDGSRRSFPVEMGSNIRIIPSNRPLRLVNYRDSKRNQHIKQSSLSRR